METAKLGAQLYTVRDHTRDLDSFARTIHRIAEIGYPAVQISGTGPMDPRDMISVLDREGVVCCITHESSATILDNPESLVEKLQTLRCRHTAFPSPGGIALNTSSDVLALAKRLDRSGEILLRSGITLSYHNHNGEFRHVDGRCILDTIYANTAPRHLAAELDTYWIQAGGGCVAEWCRRMHNRLPVIHLKDFGLKDDCTPVFREIGYGNLCWKEILSAARQSGTEWYVVEQDGNWFGNDPFESLRMSFDYLSKLNV